MTGCRPLLALALILAPASVLAQQFHGIYIGAGAGYNLPENANAETNFFATPPPMSLQVKPAGGFVGLTSAGYSFGNGFRLEVEGSYRGSQVTASGNGTFPTLIGGGIPPLFGGGGGGVFGGGSSGAPHIVNKPSTDSFSGNSRIYAVMVNALYDVDVGTKWVFPYVGAGVGYAWTYLSETGGPVSLACLGSSAPANAVCSFGFPSISNTQGGFAFQVIGGLAFPIAGVPGLSATAEYRLFGIPGDENLGSAGTLKLQSQYNHSFLLGVRYAFDVAPPVPTAAPAAVPAQAPARSYLVFFDWDKATLTDRARQIIKEAADNSTHVQYTRIEVNGYTDTSGTPQYNQGLSIRRAKAVQAELIKDGVPGNAITIQGFGETHLLVPTGPGVREPQNRRVEIIIR